VTLQEFPSWLVDSPLVARCLWINSVIPRTQGDLSREWLRAMEANAKWKQKRVFILISITLWTFASQSEEPVLLAKAVSKSLLQKHEKL
jgi:hypothetical protein